MPKNYENLRLFLSFGYFGQLANMRLYDGIVGQLGPQPEAQNLPNSTQDASKIYKNRSKQRSKF